MSCYDDDYNKIDIRELEHDICNDEKEIEKLKNKYKKINFSEMIENVEEKKRKLKKYKKKIRSEEFNEVMKKLCQAQKDINEDYETKKKKIEKIINKYKNTPGLIYSELSITDISDYLY